MLALEMAGFGMSLLLSFPLSVRSPELALRTSLRGSACGGGKEIYAAVGHLGM